MLQLLLASNLIATISALALIIKKLFFVWRGGVEKV